MKKICPPLTLVLTILLLPGLLAPRQEGADHRIDSSSFARLMTFLSEPEGYFDSDNFVSNEAGYLKITPALRRLGICGGVYLGVGPDQNFSYIAEIKPRLAIIIDIRRQNALEHLYFKALFQLSANRVEYLERLFGRSLQHSSDGQQPQLISDLLDEVDQTPPQKEFQARRLQEAMRAISSWNLKLESGDLRSVQYVAQAFFDAGPALKFTSYGRAPRLHHPSYKTLLEETDSKGSQVSYLAEETRFQFVKALQRDNLVIPVVGDLSGRGAMTRVGQELRRRGLEIECLYVSNVEFYLFGTARWKPYVQNLTSLPWAPNAFMIRSCSNMWRSHPAQMPGYYMTTLLESVRDFLHNEDAGKNDSYWNLVTLDNIVR